ncbi:HAD family hydrolase [Isoptericola chiayiensis]|uniref:HAD family hydrolase n=1 Tax=Isoptericola chiayiensis TaxID=579446 RepID=A0ABP8YGB2_9MICO|nr:HAD family hydrolase [Isoptericola chiayiensis]NOW00188.1 FMN phosphatase YigB (HAD superfamily) [Isoptericola chiayiensis]
MTPTILFDFDGTLAVGDGPVLAFARQVAGHAGPGYLERVMATLRDLDAGTATQFRDGYDVVGTLARQDGVDPTALQDAYLASRSLLGTPEAPVDAAPGLTQLLDALPHDVRVVLATNAPGVGVERLLTTWGVRERFAALHYDVGKPAGLTPIVEAALADGPVLAVGDIVENDLAPATALGAATALVGPTADTPPSTVTMHARTLDALALDITAWAHRASNTATTAAPTSATPATHPESVPTGTADSLER